jgi:hypothetical protein
LCSHPEELVVDTLLTPIIPAQLREDGPKCSPNSGRRSPSSSPQRRELWRPEDSEDTSTDSRKERATSPGKTKFVGSEAQAAHALNVTNPGDVHRKMIKRGEVR